jgi:hypothetical protein
MSVKNINAYGKFTRFIRKEMESATRDLKIRVAKFIFEESVNNTPRITGFLRNRYYVSNSPRISGEQRPGRGFDFPDAVWPTEMESSINLKNPVFVGNTAVYHTEIEEGGRGRPARKMMARAVMASRSIT